jgi:phospholipase D1/2
MEFQYKSISRGDNSIFGQIRAKGANPEDYISVFNLRNYDRLRVDGTMARREEESGVDYNTARREADDMVGAGYDGRGEGTGATYDRRNESYNEYQNAADNIGTPASGYDSISACYTNNGPDVREIPWEEGGNVAEIDAFVSEELYIHTKLLIADDRVVICGSANLNDRSQLGYHDSEIAVIIEDSTPVESSMNGRRYIASKYAASLRRQLFRKHLGLLKWQDPASPDANFLPVDMEPENDYDWDSEEDRLVADPLSEEFEQLWHGRAAKNTEIFARVFHPVPADNVRNWDDYKEFFSKYFIFPGTKDDKKDDGPKNKYGHVVKEEFAEGEQGVREVKELLSQIRGTLVQMPLNFLADVDMAKEGLSLNAITEPIYT